MSYAALPSVLTYEKSTGAPERYNKQEPSAFYLYCFYSLLQKS